MCGVIGLANQLSKKGNKWFSIGRDSLGHRGPDNSGEWWSEDRRVYLGHRRLAIIDLSPAGHQPMMDERG